MCWSNFCVVTLWGGGNDAPISVDTKKKELIGDYKNPRSDYRPQGCPDAVNMHDFPDKQLGKVVPYEFGVNPLRHQRICPYPA